MVRRNAPAWRCVGRASFRPLELREQRVQVTGTGEGLREPGSRFGQPRVHDGEQELLEVREVRVERTPGVPGPLDDLLDRSGGEALPGELVGAGREEALPRPLLGFLACESSRDHRPLGLARPLVLLPVGARDLPGEAAHTAR